VAKRRRELNPDSASNTSLCRRWRVLQRVSYLPWGGGAGLVAAPAALQLCARRCAAASGDMRRCLGAVRGALEILAEEAGDSPTSAQRADQRGHQRGDHPCAQSPNELADNVNPLPLYHHRSFPKKRSQKDPTAHTGEHTVLSHCLWLPLASSLTNMYWARKVQPQRTTTTKTTASRTRQQQQGWARQGAVAGRGAARANPWLHASPWRTWRRRLGRCDLSFPLFPLFRVEFVIGEYTALLNARIALPTRSTFAIEVAWRVSN
jgi:hypothetical protein